jgi:hypothetical protein
MPFLVLVNNANHGEVLLIDIRDGFFMLAGLKMPFI